MPTHRTVTLAPKIISARIDALLADIEREPTFGEPVTIRQRLAAFLTDHPLDEHESLVLLAIAQDILENRT